MLYYQIEADIYAELGEVSKTPKVPDPESRRGENTGFLEGCYIKASVPNPLEFEVSCRERVPHLLGSAIPLISATLADCLRKTGADNLQVFPAILRNPETGKEWGDHLAFNIVGLVDAADIPSCRFSTMMDGDENVPQLLDFKKLVFSRAKTYDLCMFRLLQDGNIYVIDRVLEGLRRMKPAGGWGFTSTEIEVR